MKRFVLSGSLLGMVLLVAGCSETTSPVQAGEPLFSNHKNGGGTTETDPTAKFYIPAARGSLGIWGDGLFADVAKLDGYTGFSRYGEKDCGVHSKIFYTGSGDAIMHTSNPRYSDKKCTDYPRKIKIDFSKPLTEGLAPGEVETVEAFVNTLDVQDNTTSDGTGPIVGTEDRPLNLSLTGSKTCDGLRFRPTLPAYNNMATGVENVEVTRVDVKTWRVRTKADELDSNGNVLRYHAKAACLKNDVIVGTYHMPVDFYIVADQPLPL